MIRTDIIKSINQILIKQAQEQKSKIAFSDIFSQISYIELDIKTSHFAKNIIDQGINKGESVALILPNSVEWVTAACS